MLYTMFVSAVTVLMLLAIGSTLGSEQNCQVTDFVSIPGYEWHAHGCSGWIFSSYKVCFY